ncbi:hypothetical protein BX666DRAFT_1936715 [Dichotomocladium elegans]|nr:hypothetical protein BX666DRAFT_1936715 [Dichotomocladium elegans]
MFEQFAAADEILDQSQSERIKEILQKPLAETGQKEEYHFFRRKCRLPDPLWIEDNYPVLETSTRDRENFIYDMSATAEGRKFLLHSGCIRSWFRRDWACPHTLYQWLFQIVAFETDQAVAKHAYETLTALWSNLGAEPAQYVRDEDLKGERNQNRHIDIDEFIYVLKNYGAVKSELAEDCNGIPPLTNSLLSIEDWSGQAGEQRIPLNQFMLVLRLFGYSVRNWPEAYRQVGIKYVIRLMFQISLDRVGSFIVRELQDGIESCLSVLSESNWKTEVQMLVNELCTRFNTVDLQHQLLQVMKPTYDRCIYMRRLIALTSLVQAIPPRVDPDPLNSMPSGSAPEEQPESTSTVSSNSPNTSEYETASLELSGDESFLSFADSDTESINKERDMAMLDSTMNATETSDSDIAMQQIDNTITRNVIASIGTDNILQETLDVLVNPKSIFQQRTHHDYRILLYHTNFLDACIGSDEEELFQEQVCLSHLFRKKMR